MSRIDRFFNNVNAQDIAKDQAEVDKAKAAADQARAKTVSASDELAKAQKASGFADVAAAQQFATDVSMGTASTSLATKLTAEQTNKSKAVSDRDAHITDFKKTLSTDAKGELMGLLGLSGLSEGGWFTSDKMADAFKDRVLSMPDQGWANKLKSLRDDGYGDLADKLDKVRNDAKAATAALKGFDAKISSLQAEITKLPEKAKTAQGLVALSSALASAKAASTSADSTLADAQTNKAADEASLKAHVADLQTKMKAAQKLYDTSFAQVAAGCKATGLSVRDMRYIVENYSANLSKLNANITTAQNELKAWDAEKKGLPASASADLKASIAKSYDAAQAAVAAATKERDTLVATHATAAEMVRITDEVLPGLQDDVRSATDAYNKYAGTPAVAPGATLAPKPA